MDDILAPMDGWRHDLVESKGRKQRQWVEMQRKKQMIQEVTPHSYLTTVLICWSHQGHWMRVGEVWLKACELRLAAASSFPSSDMFSYY